MTNTKKSLKQETCFLQVGKLGRWPIDYNKKTFRDRSYLYEYLCKNNINYFPHKMFLHSNYYYVRIHLEEIFNRYFSYRQIKNIIQDKSWQWREPLQNKFEKKETDAC